MPGLSAGPGSVQRVSITADLQRYLQESRDCVLSSLSGLSEYDMRRPLTPSGTNLLGIVKHLAGVELAYLGVSAGRPARVTLPWVEDGSIWVNADMWATADESSGYLIGLYRTAWHHSDETISSLGLDAPARVAWWPEERRQTTIGSLLVRVVAETAQHAGHCDVLRESIDGRTGSDQGALGDEAWWAAYVARIQDAADQFKQP